MKYYPVYLLLAGIVCTTITACTDKTNKATTIKSGTVWHDTGGTPINAHGGGIMHHDGVYYWYGEYKGDSTYWNPNVPHWECYRTEAGGISCYSSKDLCNWTFEGIVLEPEMTDTTSDLHYSHVLERPKVIYNDKTGQFVMWLHVDSDDYSKAAAGVAVCDKPDGKFTYLGSMRPNGQMSRDMTLFKDDDGKAYHIYSSEQNATLHISLLSDDYLHPTGHYTRNFINRHREAPAIFKHDQKYYMITSGCSGWNPNQAEYAIADSVLGIWTVKGNPCIGENSGQTFLAQSTFVLPVHGDKGSTYIAMFDRWNKTDLIDSRYVWLPIIFKGESMEIHWLPEWDVNAIK